MEEPNQGDQESMGEIEEEELEIDEEQTEQPTPLSVAPEKIIHAPPKSVFFRLALACLTRPIREVIALLEEQRSHISEEDSYGCNLLTYAAQRHPYTDAHHLCSALMKMGGLSPTALDQNKQTPVFYAAREGNIPCAELFIAAGCDVSQRDFNQQTPMYYAARKGQDDIIRFLLRRGAHIDHRDHHREPALFYAARNGHRSSIELMIEMGADPSLKVQNKSAASYARAGGHETLADWLESYLPDPAGDAGRRKRNLKLWWQTKGHKHLKAYPWLKSATKVLYNVCQFKWSALFQKPVDVLRFGCPDYAVKIKEPMDLGTIRKKLQGWRYKTATDFESDFYLMLSNCFEYNAPDTLPYGHALILRTYFEQEVIVRGLYWFLKQEQYNEMDPKPTVPQHQDQQDHHQPQQQQESTMESQPPPQQQQDQQQQQQQPDYSPAPSPSPPSVVSPPDESSEQQYAAPELLVTLSEPFRPFPLPPRTVDWTKQAAYWFPPKWPPVGRPEEARITKKRSRRGSGLSVSFLPDQQQQHHHHVHHHHHSHWHEDRMLFDSHDTDMRKAAAMDDDAGDVAKSGGLMMTDLGRLDSAMSLGTRMAIAKIKDEFEDLDQHDGGEEGEVDGSPGKKRRVTIAEPPETEMDQREGGPTQMDAGGGLANE
ncbi:unnamed protein product [Vitrella brassicaformis CCMP3155]|uniref:Bromo domain-containing protein n=1 Tax=Vitrella brassicaformis (strain CCMP3155) TaxID=1169540 RepID=A0A0G4GF76_VITBC|nr:unnamed protein product [Vitrella brassicaformis CCMP3155]|eukprot:CEM28169.1 unnamed protein product [Vitrella brassicaformis CCMP3155]